MSEEEDDNPNEVRTFCESCKRTHFQPQTQEKCSIVFRDFFGETAKKKRTYLFLLIAKESFFYNDCFFVLKNILKPRWNVKFILHGWIVPLVKWLKSVSFNFDLRKSFLQIFAGHFPIWNLLLLVWTTIFKGNKWNKETRKLYPFDRILKI